jgi:hypothetical protein
MNAAKFTYKLVLLLLGLLLIQSLVPAHLVMAQEDGGPAPRPPVGGGGSSSGSDGSSGGDGALSPPKSGVSGFVYDYTSGTNQAGVIVVAQGSSAQVETVTDSNGYYQLGTLDLGKVTLNLRLPPNAPLPVAPNWPVMIDETGQSVNLGLYWDDPASIPVRLMADLNDDNLTIMVENSTDKIASGGTIEIMTPPYLRMTPMIVTTQGEVADYAALHSTVVPGDIGPDTTATVELSLAATAAAVSAAEVPPIVQVSFTYDQQMTPQLLEIDVSELVGDAPAADSGTGAGTMFSLDEADEVITPDDGDEEVTTETSPVVAEEPAVAVSAAESPANTTSETQDEGQPVVEEMPLAESSEETTEIETAEDEPLEQVTVLPVTGEGLSSINLFLLFFAALIGLSLMIGGWRAVRQRQS